MAMAALSPMLSVSLQSTGVRNSPAILSQPSSSSSSRISSQALLSKNLLRVKTTGSSLSVPSRLSRKSQSWRQVNNTYADDETDVSSPPIDVFAQVRTQRIVVLGGNGFVGTAIAKAAIKEGIEVVSLSRSGRPPYRQSWFDRVLWVAGDVFTIDWDVVLHGATAVVSTLGGFGTNEQMEKINGDANIVSIQAAKNAGIKKFIYISVHDYNLPGFALKAGYFTGKRRAEQELLKTYPEYGTILRPGFIYGSRRVGRFEVPLNFIGAPLERLLARTEVYTTAFSKLPATDLLLAPPVSVENVALAALQAIKDDTIHGIVDIKKIKEMAAV